MKIKFKIEETVYLKTDPELSPRIVTAYKVSKGFISYEVACGAFVSWHYDFEMMSEVPTKAKPGLGI